VSRAARGGAWAWARSEWLAHQQTDAGDARARGGGTAGNERLTAAAAVVLLPLLVAEGVTALFLGTLLPEHIFIGMLLIPPVALKLASTGYRFLRYYGGGIAYRRKGPPRLLLRMLGPLVALSTVALLATGVALIAVGRSGRGVLLSLHQASFVVWIVVTGVHVLAYVLRVPRLAAADWRPGGQGQRLRAAGARRALVVATIVGGVLLGALTLPLADSWTDRRGGAHDGRRDEAGLAATPSPSRGTPAATPGPRGLLGH
jgi:hypothetical protein